MFGKRYIFFLVIVLLSNQLIKANQGIDSLWSINGFLQFDAQILQSQGTSYLSSSPKYSKDKDSHSNFFYRYGLRRGGLRLNYKQNNLQSIIEMDINDGGVYPKAMIIGYKPMTWLEINAGLQTVFFGREVWYSTPEQETLEHCELIRHIFPLDRDLGLKVSIMAPETFLFKGTRLDLGLVSGNSINKVEKSKVNFISRLSYQRQYYDFYFQAGLSTYLGSVTRQRYIGDKKQLDRRYFGGDIEARKTNILGLLTLKSEFICGSEPITQNSFASVNGNEFKDNNAYISTIKFYGGYLYCYQQLKKMPFTMIGKFTYLCPKDKKLKQMDNFTNLFTYSLGLMYTPIPRLRFTALWSWNVNTIKSQSSIYNTQLKDNNLHIRMQYSF